MMTTGMTKQKKGSGLFLLSSRWRVSLSLFLLALIPRILDLGRFLTADEFLWVDRSRNFLAALTNSAYQCTSIIEKWGFATEGLACTLRTGHPGVTTMWTGSLGFVLRWLVDGRPGSLHDYVVSVSTNPLDSTFIAPERLGTVLITSLWVVAVYWLVRRLVGPQVALITALLLALDPFHIALSRVIHHDALSTTFMTLSALCMLIYWGQAADKRWLLWSGVLAGFGFLSKSPALFLMPFVAVVGLWFAVQKIKNQAAGSETKATTILLRTVLDGLLWFAVAVVIFFLFWPAMWVVPLEALNTVLFFGTKYATGGHAKGNFFLGQVSNDPGPLFYPVTWFTRISPLVFIGLGAFIVTLFKARQSDWLEQSFKQAIRRYLPLILIFVAGYYLLMTVGEKKQDRYFLPVYPWLNFLAAGGLLLLTNSLTFFKQRQLSSVLAVSVAVIIINGFFVLSNFPYYFTYYNPLVGGIRGAEKIVTIGWGEGLDLAADYLNEKDDGLRVASWYQSTFAPFYEGTAISYSKEKGKVLAGDYVVFYVNQIQRQFPDEVMFDYFTSRTEPEQTISLGGVEYAWIYPSLGVDHYVQDQTYTGIASLLAWQWLAGDQPLVPGEAAEFELYWEYLGKKPEEAFFFRLVDNQGRPWAEGESQLEVANNPAPASWRYGEIIAERGAITPPVGMPPGQYRLVVGFYTQAEAVRSGELLFELPADEALITLGHTPDRAFELPVGAVSLNESLVPALTLQGASWPDEALSDTALQLDLYWQVAQPLPSATELHVGLMDINGEPQQAWFNLSLAETINPTDTIWQPGDQLHTRWLLDLQPDLPPGEYTIELVWADDIEQTVAFGQIVIE